MTKYKPNYTRIIVTAFLTFILLSTIADTQRVTYDPYEYVSGYSTLAFKLFKDEGEDSTDAQKWMKLTAADQYAIDVVLFRFNQQQFLEFLDGVEQSYVTGWGELPERLDDGTYAGKVDDEQ